MKTRPKMLAGLIAALLLAGCAGGGGGGKGPSFLEVLLCTPLGLPPDCGERARAAQAAQANSGSADSQSATTSSSAPTVASASAVPPPTFTSWAIDSDGGVQGPAATVGYSGQIDSVGPVAEQNFSPSAAGRATYDAQGQTFRFGDERYWSGNLSGLLGHRGIDVYREPVAAGQPASPFTAFYDGSINMVANPYVAGWEYQSFGVWNGNNTAAGGALRANSFGAPSPVSAVPLSGSAVFTGHLGGLYVSPDGQGSMAAANVTVNADFTTRSLGFASTGTRTTRDFLSVTAAPHLDLSGTLTYSSGSSVFAGTLTNAGGTMTGQSKGQFYGPAAQELGGVFAVKSPATAETFVGAYGAKR